MMKELECLKRIDAKNYLTEREHREFYSIIEKAIERLEAIDNAKPSKALECLEEIATRWSFIDEGRNEWFEDTEEFDTIKQSLLKAQEHEKENAKYKQLEEQLGCPLDVVFKLINQNELYYQFYDELQHWTSVKVDLRKKVVWYCKQVGGHYACNQPLSNYGKTFWLKKDKSE